MGKVVATIEARLGSSRLPGKIFLDLAGKPVLLHIYERLAQARLVDQVVVATTDSTGDDPIEAFCQQHGLAYFRGSEHDVLKRGYAMPLKLSRPSLSLNTPVIAPWSIPSAAGR